MQLSLPDNIERQTYIAALHAMAGWPLGELFDFIDGNTEPARKLSGITVAEFLGTASPKRLLRAELVLELAPQLSGDKFDQLAFSVLHEVYPEPAKAGFLRQRLGVPRWRIQASMLRLVDQGKVAMSGRTSGRRYVAKLHAACTEPCRA